LQGVRPLVSRAALFLALAACLACEGAGGVPGEALHDPYTERLVVGPYPPDAPWPQVTDEHAREGTLSIWAPDPLRKADNLTQQVLFGRQKTAPAEAAQQEVIRISKLCTSVQTDGPSPATEDGNDAAYAEVTCADGTTVLFKVIRGHEALYLVRREFARPPSPQERRAIH